MRLVVAAAVALTAGAAAAQPVVLGPAEGLISVEAQGVYRSRPDLVEMSAGVVAAGATAREAVEANAAMAEKLVAAVRAAGIQARDVQTESLSLRPRFSSDEERRARDDGQPPRILGYVATNRLRLRLRDVSQAGNILGALFAAGANEVRGPVFSLVDDTAARRAAERVAVASARAEAENYAAALGKRVGRVLRVADRRNESERYGESIVVTGSRIARTPIEAGEIETSSSVFVDFALIER